jgi:histidinol-phosphate/aromatic aminotransferase/cobyric acid decarboxylase-like protein
MGDEKDRFYSRLAAIPGIQPMPSIGDWILLQVQHPAELSRKVARRMKKPDLISVPRNVRGAVRVIVSDPKTNEELLRNLREFVA